MSNGWDTSAEAWIAALGERGDLAREHILDPLMIERIEAKIYRKALDVGCGEGRLCRLLRAHGVHAIGVDPTVRLLEEARRRDPAGDYRSGAAERLPFPDAGFDLVISCLTLIDIADFRAALTEMARVLTPGGTLLIVNLNSYVTASPKGSGWMKDHEGRYAYYAIDNYMEERGNRVEWAGIRIVNWHRPFSAYVQELLRFGLTLSFFDEPQPRSGDPARVELYRRMPWFHVMEWEKPG